jgi:RHS repeat-associated protein
LLLLVFAQAAAILAQNGPPSKDRYIIVLKPPKNGVPELSDHVITAGGGKVEYKVPGIIQVTLPEPAVEAMRKQERVKYIQKVILGPLPNASAPATLRMTPSTSSLRATTESTPPTWRSGTYKYDASGNIYAIGVANDDTGSTVQHRYAYDGLSRLKRADTITTSTHTETFTYDVYGNLTEHVDGSAVTPTPVEDPNTNRLAWSAAHPYTYDAAGNLTADYNAAYLYDPFSMLREKDYGSKQEFYIYTASDERIGVKYGTANDSPTIWSIRDFSGNVLRQYESHDQVPQMAWLWKEDYVYRDGQLLAAERVPEEGGRRHFHLDHLGSPRLVTGQDSKEMSEHDFEPFGLEANPSYQEYGGGFDREDPKQFTGHERDYAAPPDAPQSAFYLDYMHARYYNPTVGRFLSVDPLRGDPRSPQSFNRYAYVMNGPVSYVDPNGLFTWKFWEWFGRPDSLPKANDDSCYECWILGVKPDITVYGKDPDPVKPQYSVTRVIDRPDFGTFTLGGSYYGIGLSGHVTVDRKMRIYVGAGPTVGSPGPVGSLFLGRLDRDSPKPAQIADVLSNGGWNVSGGAGPGVGRSYIGDLILGFAGRSAATEAGWEFFPGAGVSWHYSAGPFNTTLTPQDGR